MTRARPDALYPPLAHFGRLAEVAAADSGRRPAGRAGRNPGAAAGARTPTAAESTPPAPMATPAAALRAPATAPPAPPPLFGGGRSTVAPESAAGAVESDLETPADEPVPEPVPSASAVSLAIPSGSGAISSPHRPSGRRRNLPRRYAAARRRASGCPRRRPWAPRLRIPAAGAAGAAAENSSTRGNCAKCPGDSSPTRGRPPPPPACRAAVASRPSALAPRTAGSSPRANSGRRLARAAGAVAGADGTASCRK